MYNVLEYILMYENHTGTSPGRYTLGPKHLVWGRLPSEESQDGV